MNLTRQRFGEGGVWPWTRWLAVVFLVWQTCGCASRRTASDTAAGLPPRNVYVDSRHLPGHLKRVALLPVAVVGQDVVLNDGRAALQPVLEAGLIRSARFEVISVTSEQLRQWTGRTSWVAADPLPAELLGKLREATGSDAVMFAHLTQYRPYPPLAVGWRMQLVEFDPIRVLWAVDEVFDVGDPAVAGAARSYAKSQQGMGGAPQDAGAILMSPRRFGQYTVSALVGTLPTR